MNKFGPRVLATFVIATMAFVGIGASAASARTPNAHSSSFYGTYKTKLELEGAPGFFNAGTIVLNANGTATGSGLQGLTARWSNQGADLTIVLKAKGVPGTATLTAVQTPKGLSSKKSPGDYETGGTQIGLWYGVKAS